jgi:hypothetical protein
MVPITKYLKYGLAVLGLATLGIVVAQPCYQLNVAGKVYSICEPPPTAPYDLGTLPTFLSDLQWPTEPTTSSTVEVTVDGDWTDADNTLYNVAAGTYTAKTITCSNCEFVLADGADIQGLLTFNGNTIKWTGGKVTGGSGGIVVGTSFTNDLLIDNLYVNAGGTRNDSFNFSGPGTGWNRMAIINTTLYNNNTCVADCWAFYIQREFPITDGVFRGQNLILANNLINSEYQTWRVGSIHNAVIVDTYLNSINSGINGWRFGYGSEDFYTRNVISVDASVVLEDTVGDLNGYQHEDVEHDNLTRYNDTSLFGVFSGPCDASINATIKNSTGYITNPPFTASQSPNFHDCADGGGNETYILEWDGTTLPSDTTYGADHS